MVIKVDACMPKRGLSWNPRELGSRWRGASLKFWPEGWRLTVWDSWRLESVTWHWGRDAGVENWDPVWGGGQKLMTCCRQGSLQGQKKETTLSKLWRMDWGELCLDIGRVRPPGFKQQHALNDYSERCQCVPEVNIVEQALLQSHWSQCCIT